MADNVAVATAYIDAVGDGRLEDVATYLDPAMTFESPGLPTHDGAESYLAALERLRPIIARNDIRSVLADGDRVCVRYDFVTDTPVGAVVSAEWLTLTAGRITSVYLLFDKARWPEVLEHLNITPAEA
jgi:hypothetical protein